MISIKAMARNRPIVRKIKIANYNMRLDLIQGVQPWKLFKVPRNPVYKHPSKNPSILLNLLFLQALASRINKNVLFNIIVFTFSFITRIDFLLFFRVAMVFL